MSYTASTPLRCDPKELLRLREAVKQLGFASTNSAIADECVEALRVEAAERRRLASVARGSQDVAYQARTADLGRAARWVLQSHSTTDLLQSVFNGRFILTPEASCYTYYECGDFLGPHRDREAECAVTLILYLEVKRPIEPPGQTGLELRVYSSGSGASLPPRLVIPTHVGTLVVGHGSRTWHERPALQPGEYLAALTACFKPVS